MRTLRLARIAMEAESLRLREMAKRAALRMVWLYLAMAMLFCALGFGHLAAWFWLRETLSALRTAGVFAAADLVLALVLTWLAFRSSPGAAEREALAVRRRAVDDAMESLSVSALLIRAIDLLLRPRAKP